jgi:predicted phosphodiesterase
LTLSCDSDVNEELNYLFDDSKIKNEQNEAVFTYLFMAHIYDEDPIIDKRINKKVLERFDQIWLGGDLTHDSSVDCKLNYLDSVLGIRNENTHWSFGNHDIISGRERLLEFMNRPLSYYATYINGITLLVFDSNYNDNGDCKDVNEQTNFIKTVCDTISKSSHLILMGHHVPWGKIDGLDVWPFANTSIENRVFQCDSFGFFKNIIYPELVQVQNKNIQVVSLAGDLGQKQSTFQFKSKEGIYFLANGCLSSNAYNTKFAKDNFNDSVLVFKHIPGLDQLTWSFVNVGKD